MHVGSISFGLDILANDGDNAGCTPCLRARASVLEDKLSYAEELIAEILLRTKFEDKKLMRELITQIDEDTKRAAASAGHKLALYEARSHWSARDAAAEAVNALGFMKYMHKMSAATDDELDGFIAFAKKTIADSINRHNVKISVTASEYADISGFAGMLPDGEAMPASAAYESKVPRRLGIKLPSAVSFSCASYDMTSDGFSMNGSMAVAANIVSLAHLWNEIRVQGGAYGASMSAGRTGSLFCYTYRDPDPARSIGKFGTSADFITAFSSAEDLDPTGFIISTIANTEPLLSPAAKGRAADDFWFSGYSFEDRLMFRKEMLGTGSEDLARQSEVLAKMTEKACICVAGPEAALEACEGLEIVDM
jgi:Zn-dependent M16 (insulinase) family peptidase